MVVLVVMPQLAAPKPCSPSVPSRSRRLSLVGLHPIKLYCSVQVVNPVITSRGCDLYRQQESSVGSSPLCGSREKGGLSAGALTLLRHSWHRDSMARQQRCAGWPTADTCGASGNRQWEDLGW